MIVGEWQERFVSSVSMEAAVLEAGALLVAGIALAALAVVMWTWRRVVVIGRSQPRERAEAILVLGARAFPDQPSRELQARLDHAAKLWHQGAAGRIICSGGWDGPVCEPVVMARALIRAGVSGSAVEVDDRGACTRDSVTVAADYARGGASRMLFVSSPYHLYRLTLEARKAGLDASVSAPPSTPITRRRSRCIRQHAREVLGIWRIWVRSRPRAAAGAKLVPLGDPALAGVRSWRS
jgi:vancomycin permeability regulator SanA